MSDKIIEALKKQVHKPGVNKDDWDKVNPKLLLVADYLLAHAETHQLPVVFSSIIRPGIKGVSVSKTHAEGRAFDISVRGWSEADIKFLVDCMNEALHVGAISFSDGKEKEALYEPTVKDKNGKVIKTAHLHMQCRR